MRAVRQCHRGRAWHHDDQIAETLTMYQMVFLTLFFALALPFFFIAPTSTDALAVIGNGVA